MKYSNKYIYIDLDWQSIVVCLLILAGLGRCAYVVSGPHNCEAASAAADAAKEELDATPSLPEDEADAARYRGAWYDYSSALDENLISVANKRTDLPG